MNDDEPDAPRQLPIEFHRDEGRSRDDLAVTEANRAAVGSVLNWPDWHSPIMLLAGPVGSGKTHLAAIWRERAQASLFNAEAIGEPALPLSGAVLVEDTDRGRLDEEGLFHLINAVRVANGSLLLTSRSFPGAWNIALPDLASRLKAATTVEIGEPDDALLAAVITKLFADRQLAVDQHVVRFLVNRMDRSLGAAIDLVGRIDRMSLENKRPITRALAATALEEQRD